MLLVKSIQQPAPERFNRERERARERQRERAKDTHTIEHTISKFGVRAAAGPSCNRARAACDRTSIAKSESPPYSIKGTWRRTWACGMHNTCAQILCSSCGAARTSAHTRTLAHTRTHPETIQSNHTIQSKRLCASARATRVEHGRQRIG